MHMVLVLVCTFIYAGGSGWSGYVDEKRCKWAGARHCIFGAPIDGMMQWRACESRRTCELAQQSKPRAQRGVSRNGWDATATNSEVRCERGRVGRGCGW